MDSDYSDDDNFNPEIYHGESIRDRKSVFQGHCARVYSYDHVKIMLNKLKENKKIENAFHNMYAYRIDKSYYQYSPDSPTHKHNNSKASGGNKGSSSSNKSSSIIQDCDDDGEHAAGGRMLTLLQILNCVNVVVVVTRWYGGIQLGPARFKHINNAARDALVKAGFVNNSAGPSSSSGKDTTVTATAKSSSGSNKANKKRSK